MLIKPKINSRHIPSKIVVNAICWIVSLSAIFPLIWMFYSSLKKNGEFMRDTLSLPKQIFLSNYPKAFEIGNLWTAISNSLLYSLINVIAVGVFSLIAAYFFSRYDFRGKKIIKSTYMMGILIPIYALLVPISSQYRIFDMTNNRLPLIITYYAINVSLSIFLIESFLDGIPVDIDEAATIDGCSLPQRILRIILPMCRPILATTSILTLLATWNEFAFSVILTPDKKLRTISVALSTYSTGTKTDYTFMMAALVSTSLPLIIIYLLFSTHVIKGMTAGAVKG